MEDFDSLVVGGGFHGCMVAAHLAERGGRTLLVENDTELLRRAAVANQGRLHLTFPQSLESARHALDNSRRFAAEFHDCVNADHATFLAVGRSAPKVTAAQLHTFYRQLGVAIDVAPEPVRRLFDPAHIDAVFRVEEAVIDAAKLRRRMEDRLAMSGAEVRLETDAHEVKPLVGGSLRVTLSSGVVHARRVFNCADSRLNTLHHRSGLPPLPLRHELAEVVFVDVPSPLKQAGLTILSGPFFSLTPSPSMPYHALSHTRFAPHAGWGDLGPDAPTPDEILAKVAHQTGFERMRREATRYVPCLGDLRYQRSAWEVKTFPLDGDASFAFQPHAGCRNLHAVLGARIDGVYDLLDWVRQLLPGAASRAA
jgi:glycine/D-amino acid oxidase-like deaminating enzyme